MFSQVEKGKVRREDMKGGHLPDVILAMVDESAARV